MSELMECNYCTLKAIRRRAKKEKSRVYLVLYQGGTDVYVVKKGDKLDTRKDKTGDSISKQCVAWLKQISSSCVCQIKGEREIK